MSRLRRVLTLAVTLLLTWSAPSLGQDLVLVGNPDGGVVALDRTQVINIYMGRFKKLPSGITAFPLDLADSRAEFYQLLVGKSPAEINSYWARLVFSGRGSPPRQVDSTEELLAIIADTKGAIGYLPRSAVDGRVVVLSEIDALAIAEAC